MQTINGEDIRVGDHVSFNPFQSSLEGSLEDERLLAGIVVELDEQKGTALVETDGRRELVPRGELALVTSPSSEI